MKTILVVDDEEAIRLLFQEELTEAGYRVLVAKDGPEALAQLDRERPDCITLDIKMPGMDGIDLLRQIREHHRDLPIIICSAYGDFRRDFGAWASDAFITKSSDLSELKAKIQELLELRGAG